ncbi:preprotein translocase subunit SecA [Clostridium sp.]|uniref:preprotein translocase subunit SecA n=1 Tax=Clostridium sp. TaxID=1506 RepID=UPI003216791E
MTLNSKKLKDGIAMVGILDILGTYSERELKSVYKIVDKIESFHDELKSFSDIELKEKTIEFKERLGIGESLDNLLPEAFAVVREASSRVLSMKHYRVQLIGGVILHQGRIAEMKTGEGKTLVATLSSYLNALTGEPVHIITTNDYLAKRDRDEMGRVHEFLGLTVGVILHEMKPDERRQQYNCDIVYGTNSEFGFDYLRDNMAVKKEKRVQRGLEYCVVDEIDSILIDEARTPLIISGEGEKSTELYVIADKFVKSLKKNVDYEIDRGGRSAVLTDAGIELLEKKFNIENYSDMENRDIQHHIAQALKANYTMELNKDYISKKGEIFIVDGFTGRVMEGRRFSEGLHQAIEAKEGVKIQKESKTLATITLQNYFRMYTKLSGMSGTAITEDLEFQEIYGLDVIAIPTNKPVARVDELDFVYKTLTSKYNAIIEDIVSCNKKGQPILVGTSNIQKSEDISYLLKRRGIKHYVLNAKNHEKEAAIVENAGQFGAITIATNMAGRGTDIKLDSEVVSLGGLRVIGTDRHEARRIDNQLRGRSGRQGDVGSSRFYLSLQDDLFKVYEADRFNSLFGRMELPEDTPIERRLVSKIVENAQKNVEGNSFETRKNLIGFDDVINKQRLVIYDERNFVLDNGDVSQYIKDMIEFVSKDMVKNHLEANIGENDDYEEIYESNMRDLIVFARGLGIEKEEIDLEILIYEDVDKVQKIFNETIMDMYKSLEESFVVEQTLNDDEDVKKQDKINEEFKNFERGILLSVVDEKWVDHIDNMEHLKEGIKLRAYRQVDPVVEFKMESSEAFEDMVKSVKYSVVKEVIKNSCARVNYDKL